MESPYRILKTTRHIGAQSASEPQAHGYQKPASLDDEFDMLRSIITSANAHQAKHIVTNWGRELEQIYGLHYNQHINVTHIGEIQNGLVKQPGFRNSLDMPTFNMGTWDLPDHSQQIWLDMNPSLPTVIKFQEIEEAQRVLAPHGLFVMKMPKTCDHDKGLTLALQMKAAIAEIGLQTGRTGIQTHANGHYVLGMKF